MKHKRKTAAERSAWAEAGLSPREVLFGRKKHRHAPFAGGLARNVLARDWVRA